MSNNNKKYAYCVWCSSRAQIYSHRVIRHSFAGTLYQCYNKSTHVWFVDDTRKEQEHVYNTTGKEL